MGEILHISDLHLGEPEQWQLLGSDRAGIAGTDIAAQKDVLKATLDAFASGGMLAQIKAVVVSGDLTNRCALEGFQEFAELISPLVETVGSQNIIVVPGNHDVPWDPGPDDPKRYDEFLAVTRSAGMATPILDGIDDGNETDEKRHIVVGDEFIIVPVNSSHYCWGMEAADEDLMEAILSLQSDKLSSALDDLRRHDVARISNRQISLLRELFRKKENELRESGPDQRVRIATLHHQLLPVSSTEEVKAFEALSNLGTIRELFAEFGVQAVLHGHKHTGALFWDYISHQQDLEREPQRMLISAAPASFTPGSPVMRVLRIGENAEARDISVREVNAPRRSGASPSEGPSRRARLWRSTAVDEVHDAIVLRGSSVSEVYAQLHSLFAGRSSGEPLRDVLCEMTEPLDAGLLPSGYPEMKGVADRQAWMDDLVEWWELPDPQLLAEVTFNHGQRIKRRWGDQVERAVTTLAGNRRGTTRAVIMLLDPWTDAKPHGDFPSFVLIQLQLVDRGRGEELDCSGYFRKQEMRYWWPINVAELAKVQNAVVSGLASEERPIRRGRLRTITAYAAIEEKLPAVALPEIDRAIDLHPQDLWAMAYALAHPDPANAAEASGLWARYLGDLDPGDNSGTEDLPTSYRGLADIRAMLGWLRYEGNVVNALEALTGFYGALQEQGSPSASEQTVREVRRLLGSLQEALERELAVG